MLLICDFTILRNSGAYNLCKNVKLQILLAEIPVEKIQSVEM